MNYWHYLLLVNIYLVLFYSFYVLMLKRETFFYLNRIYMVAAALLSFFIPVIQSDWVKNLFITQKVQYAIYSSPIMIYPFKEIPQTHLTIGAVLTFIYFAGVVFLTIRFIWKLIALKKLMDQSQLTEPYSFFKKIRMRENQANRDVITAHEYVHADQWHSADVMLMEGIAIISWFNPVVYLYGQAMKHIHEFIADRKTLELGTDKADYANLLFSHALNQPASQLINSFFNHSLLKQRIMMLQKNKSQRTALIKYGLSAPLFILMLILSSATINNSKTLKLINKQAQKVFSAPAIETMLAAKANVNETPKPAVKLAIVPASQKLPVTNSPAEEPERDTVTDTKIFTSVEQVPEFPGGMQAFGSFLAKNIKYPEFMRKNEIQGKVLISFIVEKDGTLTDFKVVRAIGNGADEEALRVLKMSPKWNPGVQNGQPVRVIYTVPISFALSQAKTFGFVESPRGPVVETTNSSVTGSAGNAITVKGFLIKADTGKVKNTISINGVSNNPLIVVDGTEIADIKSLNSNDILRIDVLKDKSATALYGPKGANGVLIITTKKHPQQVDPVKP